jgi:hypothetical protein
LAENSGELFFFRKKYYEIKKKYDSLLNKSKKSLSGKVLFFDYSGDLSISADLSNRLSFLYPGFILRSLTGKKEFLICRCEDRV